MIDRCLAAPDCNDHCRGIPFGSPLRTASRDRPAARLSWPRGRDPKSLPYGRSLREIFTATPDLTPYLALKSEHPLNELNPPKSPTAQASLELDLDRVDAADEDKFNRILWSLLKGGQPYPGTKRMSSLELTRAH